MLEKAKTHLVMLIAGTLLSAFSAGSILAFTAPDTSGFFTHLFLYLSIFLFCAGLITTLEIIIRQRFIHRGLYIQNLLESLRQALLVALLITGSIILSAQGILTWWVELGFILVVIAAELFFTAN